MGHLLHLSGKDEVLMLDPHAPSLCTLLILANRVLASVPQLDLEALPHSAGRTHHQLSRVPHLLLSVS